jgi:hypothetical protein
LLVTLSSTAAGQQAANQQPVDAARPEAPQWLAGLNGRFGELRDPVVMVYARARLAALVCSRDKTAGTRQFRDAFDGLRKIPDDAFDKSTAVLPVDSFTALWNLVVPPAKVCNSDVSWNDDGLDQRKDAEWGKANIWLNAALGMVDRSPERAAQLAGAALSVSNGRSRQEALATATRRRIQIALWPVVTGVGFGASRVVLDLSLLTRVLVKLRVASPDLSDRQFQLAAGSLMGSERPLATELGQLAPYLFPTGTTIKLADSLRKVIAERRLPGILELPEMPNIMTADLKGDRELAASYFADAARLVQNPQSTAADPDGAFALAWQMLPKARDLADVHAYDFETALRFLEPLPEADAARIRAELGASSPLPKAAFGSPENDAVALGQARSYFEAGRYDAARSALSEVADAPARARVEAILEFAEEAESLPAKSPEQTLEHEIYPDGGAKRSLLYAAIAQAAPNPTDAMKAVSLGLKDAGQLPPDQQVCILPALAGAALRFAPDQALVIFKQLVSADNAAEAAHNPPEAPDIRCRSTGPEEFVKSHETLLAFPLRPPRVTTFTAEALLQQTTPGDSSRFAPAVLGLRDETHLVNALLALAKLALNSPPH